MNPHQYHSTTSLKSRFTRRFLPALRKITTQPSSSSFSSSSSSSSSPKEIFQRYNRVKIAADRSMVRAAGSTRPWTRALLFRIRNRPRRRSRGFTRRIRSHALTIKSSRRTVTSTTCRKHQNLQEEDDDGTGQAQKLRKLVPGGEAMDMCNLLGETAHYIRCLNTQIQVMRSIVDLYSTT